MFASNLEFSQEIGAKAFLEFFVNKMCLADRTCTAFGLSVVYYGAYTIRSCTKQSI